MVSRKKCSKGKIVRSAYTRKNGTKVKAACTPNKGLHGKTPNSKKVLPKLKHGFLTQYGYHLSKPIVTRNCAIKKAINDEGSLPVLKHLVVLRTYDKHNPPLFKKLNRDVKYVQFLRKKIGGAKKRVVRKYTTKKKVVQKSSTKKRVVRKPKTKKIVRKSSTKGKVVRSIGCKCKCCI